MRLEIRIGHRYPARELGQANVPVFDGVVGISNPKTGRSAVFRARIGVDSGASSTFTQEKNLEVLQKTIGPLDVEDIVVSTVSGPEKVRIARNLNLCLFGKNRSGCCSKVDIAFVPASLRTGLMVGGDLLNSTGAQIDYGTKTLKCDGAKIKFD